MTFFSFLGLAIPSFLLALVLAGLLLAPDHGILAGWINARRGSHHVHHFHSHDEDLEDVGVVAPEARGIDTRSTHS